MTRKAKNMPTEEQRYAAAQAPLQRRQADQLDERATAAYKELLRTAWDRSTTDAELAQPRSDRAAARQLREQAAAAEAAVTPKKKWRLF
jgi:hypothetical protein